MVTAAQQKKIFLKAIRDPTKLTKREARKKIKEISFISKPKKAKPKKKKGLSGFEKLIFGRRKTKIPLPREKGLTTKQIGAKLLSNKERTAMRILNSPGASPVARERARKILGEID